MHKARTRDSLRLTKADSLVMLRDSLTDRNHDPMHASSTTEAAMAAPPSLTVAVVLRHGRIATAMLLAVAMLLTLTEIFRRGVQLETFDKASKTSAERSALLDKYNSYSGNAASALGRPIEILVAVMAQLVVLRFLAASLVQQQLSWRIAFAALVLGGVVGFLINNGFNAMNVQMIDIDTWPVIAPSDLSAATDSILRSFHAETTSNVTRSVSETQPANPITNTVLRNLVLAREPKTLPLCTKSYNINLRFPDDVIDYGFPQREWMKQMLPQALDARTLRIVLNATDDRVNRNVSSDKLPMNATRAADLFLTSVLLSYTYIPWGKQALWKDTYNATANSTRADGRPLVNPPTAVVAGLLPSNGSQATEQQQRDWFLRESRSFLTKRPIKTQNLSRSDIVLEFAHVDLSPTITFDSVTWQVELDPSTLATGNTTNDRGNNRTTRYTKLSAGDCGPWPAICLVPRQETDTPVVIHAFAVCANADGTETLRSEPRGTTLWDYFVQCPFQTNNSLLFFSATKRLVADSLHENRTANGTGLFPATDGSVVITNLRKIYTFTVGRLGWTWQDLAKKYRADCPSGQCKGLDFELMGGSGQRIIVGADSTPLGLVNGPYYDAAFREVDQHPLPIVRVVEPPVSAAGRPQWNQLAGDFLLRHNVANVSWDMDRRQKGDICEVVQEDRQQLVLNNHLYMETTLQSTYTAAMFFLFQNGVVKDSITLSRNKQSLKFDGNVENVAVRISIPTGNAMLTYIGCGLLTTTLVAALMWSQCKSKGAAGDPLRSISSPHAIARVMLDGQTFPSLLLHRQIVTESMSGRRIVRPADEFLVASLVLTHPEVDASQEDHHDSIVVSSAASGDGVPVRDERKSRSFVAA
jgi:hypothetical protein